jgi:hypothetical protein
MVRDTYAPVKIIWCAYEEPTFVIECLCGKKLETHSRSGTRVCEACDREWELHMEVLARMKRDADWSREAARKGKCTCSVEGGPCSNPDHGR